MNDRDKLSWKTRLMLFWEVFTKGKYDPRDYKTIHEQEQWDLCRKREAEMNACVRPRTKFPYKYDDLEQ